MRARSDRGQATVLTVVFLVVLLGMAALVLDIGSWYRADRATQSTADAAALAGAQALPGDSATANTLALQYATKNGGLGSGGVTFSSKIVANDTIKVTVKRAAPTFFAKIFGKNTVTVGSTRRPDPRASRRSSTSPRSSSTTSTRCSTARGLLRSRPALRTSARLTRRRWTSRICTSRAAVAGQAPLVCSI